MKYLDYGYEKSLSNADFEGAIVRVTEAMKKEGFDVLTQIDVKNTLERQLDVGFRKYTILGACNPRLALEALERETHIGLLLPCNMVVQESGEGRITISIADPKAVFSVVENPGLSDVVEEMDILLKRVVESIG